MKKVIAIIGILFLLSSEGKAQFYQGFNYTDSSLYSLGFLSGKYLFTQKDSIDGNGDYFKFHTPVEIDDLRDIYNYGRPTNFISATAGGYLIRCPKDSLFLPYAQVTGKPIINSYYAGTNVTITGTSPNYYINSTASVSVTTPTITTGVSRALNSAYNISATNNTRVSYTVRIAYSITTLLGSTGSVSLQYSTNGGTTYSTVSTISNNLNLGLALTGYNDFVLSGEIPANALVKLTSTTTNATNTYQTGEEIKY